MSDVNVSLTALIDVRSALKRFQNNIEAVPKNISADIASLVSDCEQRLYEARDKLKRLEQEKYFLEGSLRNAETSITNCQSQIDSVEIQISSLRGSSPNVSSSDPDAYERAAREIENRISSLESQRLALRSNLAGYFAERNMFRCDLNRKIDEINWMNNKLMRMDNAFSDVKCYSDVLQACVNKFCSRNSEVSSRNASSVALCIDYLEEYMNTNL